PDSPGAREFIELASCMSDLTAASEALDLAMRSRHEGGVLTSAESALIDYAVVAYCRADDKLKARVRMAELIEIPTELRDLHALIHSYRSRFVAHSQSDLQSTFAFVTLDDSGRPREELSTYTVRQPMPRSIVDRFRVLITEMMGILREKQQSTARTLQRQLHQVEAATAAGWPRWPEISHAVVEEYDPRSLRARYPTTITLFWSSDS
ncbi:MAG: hypothetical protein K2X36_00925, partial [Microbacteriaceae bacterium]|nr:hypothetical protein [Microbacteriaceae bacterium]